MINLDLPDPLCSLKCDGLERIIPRADRYERIIHRILGPVLARMGIGERSRRRWG